MRLWERYVCNSGNPALQTALNVFLVGVVLFGSLVTPASGYSQGDLTPFQAEIEKQRQRLGSEDIEERRDAVMRLGAMNHPEASRVALRALSDTSAIIRATAAAAILWLRSEDAAAALIPNLKDKEEFVRQESAYALGRTRSRAALAPLISLFESDKKPGVRSAAAVALGQLGDQTAVDPLLKALFAQAAGRDSKKSIREKNPFLLRAAARSLGQIGSRRAVPALLATVENEALPEDVRREAANALGAIGDPSATATLRAMLTTPDPYLSRAAYDALRKIEFQNRQR
ncbi:MAG TPA: HEAT repeat domain-containing protein [Pyrinomonadaceae bacterium]|nr:HEAT repeat domain-containing protein [Pyrinomonadaceae bacterium]